MRIDKGTRQNPHQDSEHKKYEYPPLADKMENIPNLEKDLNYSYPAEPMEGLFLKMVKGQLEKTKKNPNDYLWNSF